MGRKFHGSESSLYGLFAPGTKMQRNEKAWNQTESHQCLRLILTLLACYTTYTLNSFKNRADHFLCINKVYKVSITFLSFLAFRAGRGQSRSSSSTYFFLLLIFLSSPTSESKLASLLVRLRVLRANI